MKTNLLITLIAITCGITNISQAQLTYSNLDWINNTPIAGDAINHSASIIHTENLIITSNTLGSGGYSDMITIRYDSEGDTVWSKTHNGTSGSDDYGIDLIKDSNGDYLYVLGATQNTGSDYDFFIVKYNIANGNQIWTYTYDGPEGGMDIPSAIVLDENDNPYICGSTEDSYGYMDFSIIKLEYGGSLIWEKTYADTNLTDIGATILYDGEVYVTGVCATSPTNWNMTSLQLNKTNGAILGQESTSYNASFAEVTAACMDSDKNIYVTGYKTVNDKDIQTIKLDSTLSLVWSLDYDSGNNDVSTDISIDASGNIFVSGNKEISATQSNSILMKYSHDGALKWIRENGNIEFVEEIESSKLIIDGDDNIYLSSTIYRNNESLIGLIRYDSSGVRTLYREIETDSVNYETYDMNLYNSSLYISGLSNSSVSRRITAIKFDFSSKFLAAIQDTNSNYFLGNELIVEFAPTKINLNKIDNSEHEFGDLEDFIDSALVSDITDKLGFDCARLKTYKIFRKMTSADSLSITRLGDTIPMKEHWAILNIVFNPNDSLELIIDSLNTMYPDVRYSEKNWLGSLHNIPNDTYIINESGGLVSNSSYGSANINVDPAWDIEVGQNNTKIGIYDFPVDFTHEDFGDGSFPGSKIEGGWDFFNNVSAANSNGNANSHGTACAGIIGALRNNNKGIAGIAGGDVDGTGNTGVQLFSFGITGISQMVGEDFIPMTVASEAIVEGAANNPATGFGYGLNIQNHSWGTTDNITLTNGVLTAWRNHCIIVASRGNEGDDELLFPACVSDESVISVGASGFDGEAKDITNGDNWFGNIGLPLWSTSFGGEMDIIAPGVTEIVSAPIANSVDFGWGPDCSISSSDYSCFTGSSSAGPHVAGTAGLMYSIHNVSNGAPNNLATEDIEHFIQLGAVDKNTSGYDDETGWGLLDAHAALVEVEFPKYYVKHSGTPTSSTVTYLPSQTITLSNNVNGIAAGTYTAARYEINQTYTVTLPSTHEILDWWTLESMTYRGVSASNPVNGVPWMQITPSVTLGSNTATVSITTYTWYVINSLSTGQSINQYLAIHPFDVDYGFSLHVENTSLTKIDEIHSDDFVVYPNPTNDFINIKVLNELNPDGIITIYDLMGRKIRSLTFEGLIDNQKIDINSLSSGTYLIALENGDGIITKKFIKD